MRRSRDAPPKEAERPCQPDPHRRSRRLQALRSRLPVARARVCVGLRHSGPRLRPPRSLRCDAHRRPRPRLQPSTCYVREAATLRVQAATPRAQARCSPRASSPRESRSPRPPPPGAAAAPRTPSSVLRSTCSQRWARRAVWWRARVSCMRVLSRVRCRRTTARHSRLERAGLQPPAPSHTAAASGTCGCRRAAAAALLGGRSALHPRGTRARRASVRALAGGLTGRSSPAVRSCGCSLSCTQLRPLVHAVAASRARGCSLSCTRLHPLVHAVAAFRARGCGLLCTRLRPFASGVGFLASDAHGCRRARAVRSTWRARCLWSTSPPPPSVLFVSASPSARAPSTDSPLCISSRRSAWLRLALASAPRVLCSARPPVRTSRPPPTGASMRRG